MNGSPQSGPKKFSLLLRVLATEIELERAPEAVVWVALPGGVIIGVVTSQRRYTEEIEESLVARQDDGTIDPFLSESGVSAEADDHMPDRLVETLYLINAYLVSASSFAIPLWNAQVDFDAISAWGFGTLPEPDPNDPYKRWMLVPSSSGDEGGGEAPSRTD